MMFSFFIQKVLAQHGLEQIIPSPPNNNVPQVVSTASDDPLFGIGIVGGNAMDIIFAVSGGVALIVIIALSIFMFISRGNVEENKKYLTALTFIALGFGILGVGYAFIRAFLGITF